MLDEYKMNFILNAKENLIEKSNHRLIIWKYCLTANTTISIENSDTSYVLKSVILSSI